MKKILLSLMILMAKAAGAQYFQQEVDYRIDVALDAAKKTLDAFERITYTNHSPDTLAFIWFHLWPNAYRTDRTALSEQLLENGNTRFYFSGPDERGYINRLDFRVDGQAARTEDHPEHIDIIKLLLPQPLLPGATAVITTPFHVKLPFNVSRSGWDGTSFQLTQWYPKPAVYDHKGWHPMPYLDQGEFYSEFGNFDVRITVPEEYTVAATGALQGAAGAELRAQVYRGRNRKPVSAAAPAPKSRAPGAAAPKAKAVTPTLSGKTVTQHYRQDRVHDFAFFADRDFLIDHDTLQLDGRVIDVFAYYTPGQEALWSASTGLTKEAVRFRSNEIGSYPYNTVTVVQGPQSFGGGMEYPTITVLSPVTDERMLEELIEHEVGHNWFYGILASNERLHPWMDEGFNTFYDYRYQQEKYGDRGSLPLGRKRIATEELLELDLRSAVRFHVDQPIETPAAAFSAPNYARIAYHKSAEWLQELERTVGRPLFDSIMKTYYRRWAFRHPYPEDFDAVVRELAGPPAGAQLFELRREKELISGTVRRSWRVASPFRLSSYAAYIKDPSRHLLTISPALGRNNYDGLMPGGLLTNYKLPADPFQFFLAALYGTGSKKWNGIAQAGYTVYSEGVLHQTTLSVSAQQFSKREHLDSSGGKVFERFRKLTPALRLRLKEAPRSTRERRIEARSYFIQEKELSKLVLRAADSLYYADSLSSGNRSLHQLTYSVSDHRALYPYHWQLQLQAGRGFYRFNAEARYFFNYASGGGLQLRAFGAGFGTLGGHSSFASFRYQPKLLGVTGEEDYTYSNYFLGRSASDANDESVVENSGLAARQVMIRDGGLKLRLDPFEFLQGRSDDWVAAINLNTTLPKKIFPLPLPLRLFLDIGTQAEAWKGEAAQARFMYVGGLQLSIFKDLVNIYAPVVYSSSIRDNLKSLPEQNTFFRRMTFSIDIQNFSLRRLTKNYYPF